MTLLLLCLGVPMAPPALAETTPVTLGTVSNLPIPRFVSLKAPKGFLRRGPSKDHRVDWVLTQRGIPLRVVAEYDRWRKVEDFEDATGWIHVSLITGTRTVLVTEPILELREAPHPNARVVARVESDVVARLHECHATHCRIDARGHRGWAPKSALWGVLPDEIRD